MRVKIIILLFDEAELTSTDRKLRQIYYNIVNRSWFTPQASNIPNQPPEIMFKLLEFVTIAQI